MMHVVQFRRPAVFVAVQHEGVEIPVVDSDIFLLGLRSYTVSLGHISAVLCHMKTHRIPGQPLRTQGTRGVQPRMLPSSSSSKTSG